MTTSEVRERLAFVALSTGQSPFDTVACRPLDPAGTRSIGDEIGIAVSDATFHVERRGPAGLNPVADAIEVEL